MERDRRWNRNVSAACFKMGRKGCTRMQSGARAASCDEKYVPVDGIDFRMNAFRSRFSAQNQGFHFTFSLRGCTPRQSDFHGKSEVKSLILGRNPGPAAACHAAAVACHGAAAACCAAEAACHADDAAAAKQRRRPAAQRLRPAAAEAACHADAAAAKFSTVRNLPPRRGKV